MGTKPAPTGTCTNRITWQVSFQLRTFVVPFTVYPNHLPFFLAPFPPLSEIFSPASSMAYALRTHGLAVAMHNIPASLHLYAIYSVYLSILLCRSSSYVSPVHIVPCCPPLCQSPYLLLRRTMEWNTQSMKENMAAIVLSDDESGIAAFEQR